jgi:hypothetical protein
MITRDPFRQAAQHVKPRRKLLPIGNGRAVAVSVAISLAILAGLLLAVGALGRAGTYHGMPGRSASISGTRAAWPALVSGR